jgi:hypothetical protein
MSNGYERGHCGTELYARPDTRTVSTPGGIHRSERSARSLTGVARFFGVLRSSERAASSPVRFSLPTQRIFLRSCDRAGYEGDG